MKSPGFHFRLLATAFVLIGGAVSIMGYLGLDMTHGYIRDRFEERNQVLAGYLARNAELGILIQDRTMLERLCSSMVSEPEVVGAEIFDDNQRSLSSVFEDRLGEFSVAWAEVFSRGVGDAGLRETVNNPPSPDRIIGSVAVYFSLNEIQATEQRLTRTFALLSILVAALTIAVFYFISRSLVNPVNRLARAASSIAAGRRDLRAVPDKIPETRELAMAFNSMLDALEGNARQMEKLYEDMARQKTMAELGKFAMLIAHEVKNPLGIIKSSVDLLKDEAGLKDDHSLIFYIEDEIRRISRLLEDFLSFSRPSNPNLEDSDLNALIRECVQRFEVEQKSGPIEVVSQVDPGQVRVPADMDLMSKAVYNLLKNAAEANEQAGKIFVRTGMDNGNWFVEVEDQGPGIPLRMEEKIFEPFVTTKSRGSGLGRAFTT